MLIDSEKCDGCRICYDVCPYGAPVFGSDDAGVKAHKCTMCIDRLESGEQPICVMACPIRALDFGPLNELMQRHGERRDIEDMPSGKTTKPAIVFKPHVEKRQLVTYDSRKALQLLMRREPLPPIFSSASDVVDIPEGMVGSSELVVKHKSVNDLLRRTRNSEG